MTTKNLIALGAAAVVLGGAAYFLNGGAKGSAPRLNGRSVLPDLDVSAVAKIEFGDKLALSSGDAGWTVDTMRGYPASREKIAENLLKLTELKVGQVVRGKALDAPTAVVLRDAAGKELANLALGERHAKWGHGRYAKFAGETVLVSDTLDAFGDDPRQWVETKVVDDPWISFSGLADPNLAEAELGFKTGVVAKATVGADTNCTIRIGNAVKGGNDRYLKVGTNDWIYIVPSYSVDRFLPKPPASGGGI